MGTKNWKLAEDAERLQPHPHPHPHRKPEVGSLKSPELGSLKSLEKARTCRKKSQKRRNTPERAL